MRQDKAPQTTAAAAGQERGWLHNLDAGNMQQVALVAVCLLLGIIMQLNFPRYLSGPNVEVTLTNFVTEGIMALGMTIVMITGGIDISVAATLQFSAIVAAMLLRAGVPVPAAIAMTLLLAASVGLINASLINLFKVHPFIVTLATLLTLRGIDLVITGGTSISGLPEAFTVIGQDRLFGLRISLLLFVVLAVVIGYALKNHRYLQQAYFIGGNRRAARMSGVKVERFIVFAFVLNAVLAGIAGIVVCSQYGAASVSYGQNAELRVIAATAIGGTSFSGGSGTITGTVLGVIFLAMIYNAFNMSGINTYWQDVAIGVMLLAAVFLGEYLKRRRIART
ncbi:MAG: ABC transporter permease [Caldilineaceae bacterium]|nr:ABC transporter permease [Caldilineaceae bacterium]